MYQRLWQQCLGRTCVLPNAAGVQGHQGVCDLTAERTPGCTMQRWLLLLTLLLGVALPQPLHQR